MPETSPQQKLEELASDFVSKYRGFSHGYDDGAGVQYRDLTLTERQDLAAAILLADGDYILDHLDNMRAEYMALMFSQIASATEEVDLFDFRHTLRNYFENECADAANDVLERAYERALSEEAA